MNTTIEVEDGVSDTFFPVDVSVGWTGTGGPFRLKGHFQTTNPFFKQTQYFDGTSRSVEASGTVSDGTTNFTPG